jgi:hypothetical protein
MPVPSLFSFVKDTPFVSSGAFEPKTFHLTPPFKELPTPFKTMPLWVGFFWLKPP